jgi:hypothetical protein
MKKKSIFFAILIIGFLLNMSASVMAENITLDPDSSHSKSYELRKGDTISWDWKIPGEGYVDFWIVDELGNKYNEIQSQDASSGSFEVPESGAWSVVIKNNGQYTVTIDYKVSVDKGGSFSIFIILNIVIIIVVLILLFVMMKKKRAQLPPKEKT